MDKKNKDVLHHVNHTHREFDKETMKKIWGWYGKLDYQGRTDGRYYN